MTNLVERASASSIEWVVRMIVDCLFYVATEEITFHINRRAAGSIPVDGSSRKRILGSPIIAQATESLRLFPPESFPERLFL